MAQDIPVLIYNSTFFFLCQILPKGHSRDSYIPAVFSNLLFFFFVCDAANCVIYAID